jgi:hypothetical protein
MRAKETDMLNSAEVRWFFEGDIEAAVDAWFRAEPIAELRAENRRDDYLVFPGSESVGVKLRDRDGPQAGKFEVKASIGAAETVTLAAEVHGRADSWSKWSFATVDWERWVSAISTGADAEPTWVGTDKRRMLRKFSLDTGTALEVDPAEESRPVNGCSVEIVRLQVGAATWWTFGFESFGSRFDVRSNLRAVASHWFETRGVLDARFRVTHSVAYPTWAGTFAE